MRAELGKALRSLPWYVLGGFIFVPLLLAPFTAGASLGMYGAVAVPFLHPSEWWTGVLMFILPGGFLWMARQFVRFGYFFLRLEPTGTKPISE